MNKLPMSWIFMAEKGQRGAGTLVFTLVILVLMSIIMLGTAKTSLMEQRISNNEFRARQAFEAAQAGMERAVAYLGSNGGDTVDATTNLSSGSQSSGGSYALAYSIPSADLVQVVATGNSADNTGLHQITQVLSFKPPIPGSPKQPLIVKSAVAMSGNANVENAYSNSAIRSGGLSVSGGSATTYVCDGCSKVDPASTPGQEIDGLPPNLQPAPSGEDQAGTADGIYESPGIDILENDPYFAAATDDEFFENYFTGDKNSIRAAADLYYNMSSDSGVADSLENQTNKLIWIDGDIGLNSNTRIGCTDTHPTDCSDGTVDPVILVVNGNLTCTGAVQVYGIVYVTGDWDVQGTFEVYGSVIVEGDVEGNGTLDVRYYPRGVSSDEFKGSGAVVAGSWRDW